MSDHFSNRQPFVLTSLLLISVTAVTDAFARHNQITIDRTAHLGQTPEMVSSANGTDVLNIINPTAAGVSHNKFLEYNVSDKNLILNNLAFQAGLVQGESALGGTVSFNPNLSPGNAARVILNEVTSNALTALRGSTEIFGSRAALVIANPNGITADGAGFINVSRLSMVAGKPRTLEGNIKDFALSANGFIKVKGSGQDNIGLYLRGAPAELVADAVHIAGKIYLDDDRPLSVLTGNKSYDYAANKVSSEVQNPAGSPGATLAVDSSALGGMYAGRIRIEATQSGMGIRAAGNLTAVTDALEITAEGDIVFKNAAAKKDIRIISKDGEVEHLSQGTAHAERNFYLKAQKDIKTQGEFILAQNIELDAGQDIQNHTKLAALNTADLRAQADLKVNSGYLSADHLALKAGQNVENRARISAGEQAEITVGADYINHENSALLAAGSIIVTAGRNIFNSAAEIFAGNDLTLKGKNAQIGPVNAITTNNPDTDAGNGKASGPALADLVTEAPYSAAADQFNALVNAGGRIESFGDISILADKVYNLGLNQNTGEAAYDVYYQKLRDTPCWGCGWTELGRYKVGNIYLDSDPGSILAGRDLLLHAREILNQSSTLSARRNSVIRTASLVNKTYSETAELKINTQLAFMYQDNGSLHTPIYNSSSTYKDEVKSKEASLITAGQNLEINAAGGQVVNDQEAEALGDFRFGRGELPDEVSGRVPTDITLPKGENGLFAVGANPKYLVSANVSFLNPDAFAGSDYFFDRITPSSNEYNTRKMLGDPAYETRLIMDAIRKKTYGHYLDDGKISSDLEQMQALFDAAAREYQRLDLKIGIALTPEQIRQLNSDIIWYVEQEINGEKVLVPELYLCSATLENIRVGGSGAKITAKNMAITADMLSNRGDMVAQNLLSLQTDGLINQSSYSQTAKITGGVTQIQTQNLINSGGQIDGTFTSIKADQVINEAALLSEEAYWGTRRQEKGGIIRGDVLQMETGSLTNIGGQITGGDLSLKAESIINETRTFADDKNYGFAQTHRETAGRQAEITADKHLTAESGTLVNLSGKIGGQKSDIKANQIINETKVLTNETFISGKKFHHSETSQKTAPTAVIFGEEALFVAAKGNYAGKGSRLESGGDLSLQAENIRLDSVKLHSRSETEINKSGFLSKKSTTNIKDSVKNIGSAIVAGGNAVINSVKDLFSRGSTVIAGQDAQIIAGGELSAVAAEDSDYQFSKTSKSSWGGLRQSKSQFEQLETSLKGSSIRTKDGLTLVAGKNATIAASKVEAGQDANILAGYKAGADGKLEKSGTPGSVNIISGKKSKSVKFEKQQTDMTNFIESIALGSFDPRLLLLTGTKLDYEDERLFWETELGKAHGTHQYKYNSDTVSSEIRAGGDLNIGAAENVNIKASGLFADGDLTVEAEKEINILSDQNDALSGLTNKYFKLEASAGAGNSYIDAAQTIQEVVKAAENLKKATKEFDHIRRLHSEGKATDKALAQASAVVAVATKNLKDSIKAADAAVKAASVTSPTYGFYADALVTAETKTYKQENASSQNVGSQVAAMQNVSFNAGKDMTQVGSTVVSAAGDVTYNVAENLKLEAGIDRSSSKSEYSQKESSLYTSSKLIQELALSTSRENSDSYSEHFQNAGTMAMDGDVIYQVGRDMTAIGYNALGNNIIADIGGDLKLNSLINTDKSSRQGKQLGGKVAVAPDGKVQGAGANIGFSDGDYERSWVDDISSLIGTESVDLNIGGKLGMQGSVIANIGTDGEDKGNLKIKAGSLEASDLAVYESNHESSFSVGTDKYAKGAKDKNDGYPNGKSTVEMKDLGAEKEGVIRATIGKGRLEIADSGSIANINRDVDKVELILKDQVTGALNAKLTFSNDIFSNAENPVEVLQNIAEDFNLLSDQNKEIFADLTTTYSEYVEKLNEYNNQINSENSLLPGGDSRPPRMGQDKYDYDTKGNIKVSKKGLPKYSQGYLDAVAQANPLIVQELNLKEPTYEEKISESDNSKDYYITLQNAMNNGILQELKPSISSCFDDNPMFQFMYKYLPGAQAMTDTHDKTIAGTIEQDQRKNNDIQKIGTIPISFLTTFISLTAGKPAYWYDQQLIEKGQ